jgi:hypothetical protein
MAINHPPKFGRRATEMCPIPKRKRSPRSDRKLTDNEALDLIAAILSGQEWDSGTLLGVASIVRQTGRVIADVSDTNV